MQGESASWWRDHYRMPDSEGDERRTDPRLPVGVDLITEHRRVQYFLGMFVLGNPSFLSVDDRK
jgi:hypothetical protein